MTFAATARSNCSDRFHAWRNRRPSWSRGVADGLRVSDRRDSRGVDGRGIVRRAIRDRTSARRQRRKGEPWTETRCIARSRKHPHELFLALNPASPSSLLGSSIARQVPGRDVVASCRLGARRGAAGPSLLLFAVAERPGRRRRTPRDRRVEIAQQSGPAESEGAIRVVLAEADRPRERAARGRLVGARGRADAREAGGRAGGISEASARTGCKESTSSPLRGASHLAFRSETGRRTSVEPGRQVCLWEQAECAGILYDERGDVPDSHRAKCAFFYDSPQLNIEESAVRADLETRRGSAQHATTPAKALSVEGAADLDHVSAAQQHRYLPAVTRAGLRLSDTHRQERDRPALVRRGFRLVGMPSQQRRPSRSSCPGRSRGIPIAKPWTTPRRAGSNACYAWEECSISTAVPHEAAGRVSGRRREVTQRLSEALPAQRRARGRDAQSDWHGDTYCRSSSGAVPDSPADTSMYAAPIPQ